MTAIRPVRLGIIGCGDIARRAYVPHCRAFPFLELAACADLDPTRAAAFAAANGIPAHGGVDWLLRRDDLEVVLNLTNPQAHVAVNRACLMAGKHVWCEKPFALDLDEGRRVAELAHARGLRVASAPDTVLGSGVQTCRGLLDGGLLGEVVGGTCHMLSGGPEDWHPNPAFLYHRGAGPLLDMGAYYLHALITLIGPVRRVAAMAKRTWAVRTIGSQPLRGTAIEVQVPTHVCALLEFASGATVTLTLSFDVKGGHDLPNIELHGTTGSLRVPDPNFADGAIRVARPGLHGWVPYDSTMPYRSEVRGVGVADLALAIRSGRPHRASVEVALHALEAMFAIGEAAASGRTLALATTCERPAAMPRDGLAAPAAPALALQATTG